VSNESPSGGSFCFSGLWRRGAFGDIVARNPSPRGFQLRHTLLVTALACAAACSPERLLVDETGGENTPMLVDTEPHKPNTLRLLKLRTFDGSGQTVHPDFAQMPDWPNPFLLVATPYPFGAVGVENPSLYWRDSTYQWTPLGDRTNPIARPIGMSFLSDPDMVAIPATGDLLVYYRQVDDDANHVLLIKSRDGVHFTEPIEVVKGANHALVSPAVVRRDSTRWRMWTVNAGGDGCHAQSTVVELRRSRNGERWSKPIPVNLTQGGASVWHIDVQWIPSREEYWALYNVKTPGTCATLLLYLATSPDGVNWQTYPSPLLVAGVIPEFNDIVYRSTFAYNPVNDRIRFWYSGARFKDGVYIWESAYDRRDRAEVFTAIGKPPSAAVAAVLRRARRAPTSFDPP
jgi:hypothetical protein